MDSKTIGTFVQTKDVSGQQQLEVQASIQDLVDLMRVLIEEIKEIKEVIKDRSTPPFIPIKPLTLTSPPTPYQQPTCTGTRLQANGGA